MRVIDKEDRLPELRRLGLSPALLRLASEKRLPQLFARFRVPYKVYRGMTWTEGPLFVPLWELDDCTTAVRQTKTGLEFFAFDVEAPTETWSLAHTEQGLLATLFFLPLNMLYDDLELEESDASDRRALAAAAKAVEFLFLKQAEAVFAQKYPKGLDAVEKAYTKLVRDIDAGKVSPTDPGQGDDPGREKGAR